MGLHKSAFELTEIAMALQNGPGFLSSYQFHACQQIFWNVRPPIGETIKGIEFGEFNQIFSRGLNVHVDCLQMSGVIATKMLVCDPNDARVIFEPDQVISHPPHWWQYSFPCS